MARDAKKKAEQREEWRQWMDELQRESDRACALLGTAFLEEHLRTLLESFFVEDRQQGSELFEGDGPLSTFSNRIRMSFALGFLSPSERRDLDLIRKVRNAFAHELHGMSFDDEVVAQRCAELEGCSHLDHALRQPLGPKDRYVLTVIALANWIAMRRLEIRESRRTVRAEVRVVQMRLRRRSET